MIRRVLLVAASLGLFSAIVQGQVTVPLRLQEEGTTLGPVRTLNFTGAGITCTLTGSTGTCTVSISAADLTGTLAAAQFPALTGDVTTVAGTLATSIGAGKVTDSMIVSLAGNKLSGTGLSASLVNSSLTTLGPLTGLTFAESANVQLDTITGTKIGTSTAQKLGFFNSAPIVQPSSTMDLRTALIDLGLYATGGASPLNLNGGAFTAATATLSGLTQGSLLVAGAGGLLTQDNANLFYDATNKRLGHGTTTPNSPVEVASDVNANFQLSTYVASAVGTTMNGRKARGTQASPLRTKSGDSLFTMSAKGAAAADDVSAGAFTTDVARFQFIASEDYTSTGHGSEFRIRVSPIGSTTAGGVVRMVMSNAGNLTMGAAASDPATLTNVGPMLIFAQGTAAPAGMASNTAGLYANDVAGTAELFAVDEAGNVTQLSPHCFTLFTPEAGEPTPWAFCSQNAYLGVELGIDMAKVVRLLASLFPSETVITRQPIPRRDWVDDQETAMRQRMAAYQAWEAACAAATVAGEGCDAAPGLPVLKVPPDYLRTRLVAAGWLNAAKTTALRAELAIWCRERAC